MQEQVQARLQELKKELEAGQAELQKVESQRTYLRETMLRISGAVQALEELLAQRQPAEQNGTDSEKHHATAQVSEADIQQTGARLRKG
jgi:predicted nuclease with TOPRIM domain